MKQKQSLTKVIPRQYPCLTEEQCLRIGLAFSRASEIGMPLNTHLTIHWAFAPGSLSPQKRWQKLYDAMRLWMNRRGLTLTFVYVWEAGVQRSGNIPHIHVALHVPPSCRSEFRAKVRDWVSATTEPCEYEDRAVDVRAHAPETHLPRYLMAGAPADLRRKLNVRTDKAPNQGVVYWKRMDASKNLRDISWKNKAPSTKGRDDLNTSTLGWLGGPHRDAFLRAGVSA